MNKIFTIIAILGSMNGYSNSLHKSHMSVFQQLPIECRNQKVVTPELYGLKLYFDSPETKTKCFVEKSVYPNKLNYLSISIKNNQIDARGDIDLSGPKVNQKLIDFYFNSPNYSVNSFSGIHDNNLSIKLDVINEKYAILITQSKTNFASIFSIERGSKDDKLLLTNSYDLIFSKVSNHNNDYFSIKLYKNKADIYFGDTIYSIPKISSSADGRISFTPKGDDDDINRLIELLSGSLDRIDAVKSNYSTKWIQGSGVLSIGLHKKTTTNNRNRLSHWVRRYLKMYKIDLLKNKTLRFMTDIAVYRAMDHYNEKGELIW